MGAGAWFCCCCLGLKISVKAAKGLLLACSAIVVVGFTAGETMMEVVGVTKALVVGTRANNKRQRQSIIIVVMVMRMVNDGNDDGCNADDTRFLMGLTCDASERSLFEVRILTKIHPNPC